MVFTVSNSLYQSLFEGMADGIAISDTRGIIAYCNPALCRLVGAPPEAVRGRALTSIINVNAARTDRGMCGHEPGQAPPATAAIMTDSGETFYMPATNIELQDTGGKSCGHATMVYIIQSDSIQQVQTEFVSTVSHELRTPLTSIKGFADTILRAGDRLEIAQQRRYVGIIKDQADRLTRLVEDLLAVSRLESHKLQLTIRAVDLNEAVQRVCRNLADRSRNHTIANKIPPGLPDIWADADRLEQILTNLIDNAIKYSPNASTVTISARETGGKPEMVEFAITDRGVGIAKENLHEIFGKFSRLDSALVRQKEGTGLGLYITKSLVTALGGHISASSNSSGSTFTVALPAASLEDQAARGRG